MIRVYVPHRSTFDPVLNAVLHTGDNAVEAVKYIPPGAAIAIDIETPGLLRAFTINCLTLAWHHGGRVHAALLDVTRDAVHHNLARKTLAAAGSLILHNAPFDVPGLWNMDLLTAESVNRITDTLLLARFAFPDPFIPKSLTALSIRHLGMDDFAGGMKLAFAAAGYRTIQDGYEGMDIDSPIYRQGAMADTVATLRLEPILRKAGLDWTTDHPFTTYGLTNTADAAELLEVQEVVNRVMLRRSARGIAVDRDYLNAYAEKVDAERNMAEAELAVHGLEGGTGKGAKLLNYLESQGQLPLGWPRTPTGKLKATKDVLASLDHPLAQFQRRLAEIEKITGYLFKVEHQAEVTGRCHPQVGVLGASATGRMAYSSPELQQFPADARPILIGDSLGMTSIDWSQIEPVTMALMAGDSEFLIPFEEGADLYEPIQRAAGIDRPTAKVVLLATMYGQGTTSLAKRIGHTEESASQIRRQMLAAMPKCSRWMSQVQSIGSQFGRVITAAGRILPVDEQGVYRTVNHVVQGSALDVLHHTIYEMERCGLGDELFLAMHDEVVVSSPAAIDVQHIMLTPPPFLTRWAGRTPTLRTDLAELGGQWAKV